MAAYDDNNSGQYGEHGRALSQFLWLGAIETLINAFIDLDAATRARVVALDGLVVRVKVMDPYLPFYLVFTKEGIEACDVAPGPARVRVNARLFDLMRTLLGAEPTAASGRPRVRVWGEAESVADLESLLTDFNLRTRAQHWLRSHLNLEQLWEKLRNHDPSWLQDFLPLPGLMRETLSELKRLNQNLLLQQNEFERYRHDSQALRRNDLRFMLLAFVAMLLALGSQNGWQYWRELPGESLALLAIAALLLLSRLRA